jgi:hypothetical protein
MKSEEEDYDKDDKEEDNDEDDEEEDNDEDDEEEDNDEDGEEKIIFSFISFYIIIILFPFHLKLLLH